MGVIGKIIIDKTEKSFSLKGCAMNDKSVKLLRTNDSAIQKINKIISLIDVPEMFRPANKIATKITDLAVRSCAQPKVQFNDFRLRQFQNLFFSYSLQYS